MLGQKIREKNIRNQKLLCKQFELNKNFEFKHILGPKNLGPIDIRVKKGKDKGKENGGGKMLSPKTILVRNKSLSKNHLGRTGRHKGN